MENFKDFSTIHFSGYLNKKGQIYKTWKKRFFVLRVRKTKSKKG
jgi:hypothetical protein